MSEFIEDRLAREREERKRENYKKQVLRKAESGARSITPARREEDRRTFAELRGHVAPAAKQPAAQANEAGIPVKFYCFKDGQYGYITLSASSEFKTL